MISRLIRGLFFVAILLGTGLSAAYSQQWECAECPQADILLYGFHFPDRETFLERHSLLLWNDLSMQADRIHGYILQNDPSRPCIRYFEPQLLTEVQEIWVGIGWQNTPPEGPLSTGDYILTGSVFESGEDFIIEVRLESAGTREIVCSRAGRISPALSIEGNAAGIATGVFPLMDYIRNYERRKRESNDRIAIAPEIEIVPESDRISPEETVDVDIRMTDCDGYPLADRLIELDAEGGECEPSEVETNDHGEASFTYTADSTDDENSITATHFFLPPYADPSDDLLYSEQRYYYFNPQGDILYLKYEDTRHTPDGIEKDYLEYWISEDKLRVDTYGHERKPLTQIVDYRGGRHLMIFESGKYVEKSLAFMDDMLMEFEEKLGPFASAARPFIDNLDMAVEETDEERVIDGYLCRKYIVTVETLGTRSVSDMWVTRDIESGDLEIDQILLNQFKYALASSGGWSEWIVESSNIKGLEVTSETMTNLSMGSVKRNVRTVRRLIESSVIPAAYTIRSEEDIFAVPEGYRKSDFLE